MNDFLDALAPLAWKQIWQVAAVVLAVTFVTRVPAVRRRPHLAYALWLLVLAKSVTPPLVASPTSPFSWALARTSEPVAVVTPPSVHLDYADIPMPEDRVTPPLQAADRLPIEVSPREHVQPEPAEEGQHIRQEPAATTTVGSWSIPTVLVITWLAGTALFAAVSLGRYWRTWRRLTASAAAEALPAEQMVADLCGMLGIRHQPRAIVTEQPFGPAVLGLWRPLIIVPHTAQTRLSPDRLRLALAHELIHLRRGDHWIGLMQFLAQSIWWFHPLVWWANRETNRIREQCCDEEVVASLRCSPADYAQTLLDIVRFTARARPIALATGVSALHVTQQRLQHIMTNASRFHRATPRLYWLAATLAALFFLPGAGLALDQDKSTETELPREAKENQEEGSDGSKNRPNTGVTYTGRVIDKETGKPIQGANVKFGQRRLRTATEGHITTEHRTNTRGEFSFTLPVKQESEYLDFHLWAEVDHSDYIARRTSIHEKRTGQPFFKQIEMYRSKEVHGVVETPDGQPAKETPVIVYSVLNQDDRWGEMELVTRTMTDDQGEFRGKAAQAGEAVVWVVPDDFSPLVLDLGGKRGDLGAHRLDKGASLSGQVLDHSGKPVVGVGVRAALKDRIVFQVAQPFGGDHMERFATTDSDGRFQMSPLRPGDYDISIDTRTIRKDSPLALAPVFPTSSFRLSKDSQSAEIHAAEIVTVDVRCVDTSDRPVTEANVSLIGSDGYHSQYYTQAMTGNDGWVVLAWPKGYRAILSVVGNGREYVYRTKQDALPPGHHELVNLGRVEKDLRNIEVVQYKAAKLFVRARNERGESIAKFKPEIRYSATPANRSHYIAPGWRTDVAFVKLPDGRWQSEEIIPNEGFTISATGIHLKSDSQKLKLAEGEVKEIELTVRNGEENAAEEKERTDESARNNARSRTANHQLAESAESEGKTESVLTELTRRDPLAVDSSRGTLVRGAPLDAKRNSPLRKPIDEQQSEYAKVERLTDAIEVLKGRLEKLEMSEYTPLLTEESVKRAIRTTINGVRVGHTQAMASARDVKARQAVEREARRFLTVIKPLYDEILQSGTWPSGAFFYHSPKSPHGFSLNLHVDTRGLDNFELAPGLKPTGYGLQIIRIEYGFTGPSDAVLKLKTK
ncbi:MAG: M56 family metallopeptidase [Pirellulales bacterium]